MKCKVSMFLIANLQTCKLDDKHVQIYVCNECMALPTLTVVANPTDSYLQLR